MANNRNNCDSISKCLFKTSKNYNNKYFDTVFGWQRSNEPKSSVEIKKQDNKQNDKIDTAKFLRSSLQYGVCVNSNGKIITSILNSYVFNGKSQNGKYLLYKKMSEYLDVDSNCKARKIYKYNHKIIYMVPRNGIRF
ncbi:MAG TPA: hypothetical protein VF941_16845 [Clostridia bacterium]